MDASEPGWHCLPLPMVSGSLKLAGGFKFQPTWKIWTSKLGLSWPKVRGEDKKYWKIFELPPPRYMVTPCDAPSPKVSTALPVPWKREPTDGRCAGPFASTKWDQPPNIGGNCTSFNSQNVFHIFHHRSQDVKKTERFQHYSLIVPFRTARHHSFFPKNDMLQLFNS